jgi:16S rRNA (cytosine1402-N4)-methyltransferase
MPDIKYHMPVMVYQTIDYLKLRPGMTVVDATVGTGGHTEQILQRISPGGTLVGIDRDAQSLALARERLGAYSASCRLVHGNFVDLDKILKSEGIKLVDGMIFDLGISTYQLQNAERGFSFQNEGPLDMRMDQDSYISAYDLVNNLNEEEISSLLWNFGQERWHNRIAHLLVRERQRHPINTTRELADIVARSIPSRYRRSYYRIHPATRTFQAVRIAVNRELEILEESLNKGIAALKAGGRICVISFHSLEDRVAKFAFRKASAAGSVEIITPKPKTPEQDEINSNPSSRSSKLRVAERL